MGYSVRFLVERRKGKGKSKNRSEKGIDVVTYTHGRTTKE